MDNLITCGGIFGNIFKCGEAGPKTNSYKNLLVKM